LKIFTIGSEEVYAIESLYIKYLRAMGIEVYHYAAQSKFYRYYYKSTSNKIKFRLGLSDILQVINKEIIKEIKHVQPDFLFIFKGMEVSPATLKAVKEMGIKTFNYNPDNPFIFSSKGSGNKNVTNSISLYDFHFTYNLEVKRTIEEKYQIPAYWLPFGFDISEALFSTASSINEVIKTCFVGNPDKARVRFIMYLANTGIKIDIYGNDWSKFIKHKNITVFSPVYKDELWFTLRKYRVQLNPLRVHNVDSHGMRSFEVPAIGGIMLAPRTTEHVQFFDEGKEAFFYDNVEDAVSKVHYLLSLPKEKSNMIREAARKRSLQSGYSYKDRTAEVLNILNSIEA